MMSPIELKSVTLHTDGACEGNPGPGGWAALLRHGQHVREITGGESATTNNRMELMAAIAGLAALKEPCNVTVYTDSEYVRNGVAEWLKDWKARGWCTADRKPVKNDDLWRELDQQAARHRVTWKWLKGHAGHPENERCDRLAVAEIAKLRQHLSAEELAAARERFVASRQPGHNQGRLL